MKQSNIWLNSIIKCFSFLIFVFLLNCKRNEYVNYSLSIEVVSFKKVNKYNGYCTVVFRNKSNINYVLPTIGYVYLIKNKTGEISYDDVSKIEGKIVSSDFKYRVGNFSDESIKFQQIIHEYIDYTRNKVSLPNGYFDDFDRFSHEVLFVPKNSEPTIIIWLNAQDMNYYTLEDKKKKVVFSNIQGKFSNKESKFLDSLLLKKKINYQVYREKPYIVDSLCIR